MRAYELYETDFEGLGIYDPTEDKLGRCHQSGACGQKITLRHLHRLKHIRNRRRREQAKKQALVQTMYGNPDFRELELEQQEQKLETLQGQITLEIDAAKIDQETKDHIRQMARDAIDRQRKP